MEQNNILYNFDIFSTIVRFLSVKEKLNLMQVSRGMKENVQKALKLYLKQTNLLLQEDIPYNLLYRSLFGRETYFWSFSEEVKPFKRKHTMGHAIRQIKMGLKYTGFLTHTNELYYCTTQVYTDSTIEKPQFTIRQQVKYFNVLGKNVLQYLTIDGDMYIVFDQKEILLFRDVSFFNSSYFLSVLFFNKAQQLNIFQDVETLGVQIYLQDATVDTILAPQKCRRIVNSLDVPIQSLAVGCNNFFILYQNAIVYQSEVNVKQDIIQEQTVKVQHVPFFDKKHIISINSGFLYYVAVGREEMKAIHDWNNDELIQWLDRLGFSDYTKLVKYNDYSGSEFANKAQDKQFLIDNLGLQKEDLQIKLATELSKVQQNSFKNYQLFGWGKNDYGQLAIPLTNNAQFQRIPLPDFQDFDDIEQIECGWSHLAIMTQQGRIFMTVDQAKQQKKEKLNELEIKKEKEEGKRKKSKQIEQREPREPKEQKEYWAEVTKIFVRQNDKREYRNYYINLSKEYLIISCLCLDKNMSLDNFSNKLKMVTSKKFKPADKIIDRILWDQNLKKEEFIVGYEDRFLGIMEITVQDFQKTDIKSHRVQYFKKGTKIVWDRVKKIDLF